MKLAEHRWIVSVDSMRCSWCLSHANDKDKIYAHDKTLVSDASLCIEINFFPYTYKIFLFSTYRNFIDLLLDLFFCLRLA